jgi:hypothetical protein
VTFADALAKPVIYAQGPTLWYLVCSNDSASQYKWYYNGTLITGANKFIYVANKNLGKYHVSIANAKGCFTKSDTIKIPTGTTGIEDVDPFEGLKLFPNPTSGLMTLEMNNQLFGDLMLKIVTPEGKEIVNKILDKTTLHFITQINLSSQSKGVYFMSLSIKGYTTNRKIIIE